MKILITQSNYIPWKGYFDSINMVDTLVLYDDMQYTKRDWRNRNKIVTSQGPMWLSIPVSVKGKFFQKISETEVNDASWAIKHWRMIEQNYSKAKYFEEVSAILRPAYLGCSFVNLSTINRMFIEVICAYLNISTEIRWSSEFQLRGERSERLVNLCSDLGAKEYYTGPSARNYLDVDLFNQSNIEVKWLDFDDYPEYPQLYGEFENRVSIIDLLFNAGQESIKFMKSFIS